ncbi:hypothetical protein HGP05_02645 [Streptococcus sanguinis]|uniref:Uncharacterized protein n=1 Tax=Streptococcus sanguinis TaxID=1305 RepID=A0A7Y0VBA8_STRSA|nr:hypothetical protein [Streptococcus sanguinis]
MTGYDIEVLRAIFKDSYSMKSISIRPSGLLFLRSGQRPLPDRCHNISYSEERANKFSMLVHMRKIQQF